MSNIGETKKSDGADADPALVKYECEGLLEASKGNAKVTPGSLQSQPASKSLLKHPAQAAIAEKKQTNFAADVPLVFSASEDDGAISASLLAKQSGFDQPATEISSQPSAKIFSQPSTKIKAEEPSSKAVTPALVKRRCVITSVSKVLHGNSDSQSPSSAPLTASALNTGYKVIPLSFKSDGGKVSTTQPKSRSSYSKTSKPSDRLHSLPLIKLSGPDTDSKSPTTHDPNILLLTENEVRECMGSTPQAKLVKRTINIGEYILQFIPNKINDKDNESAGTTQVSVTKPSSPDANSENPAAEPASEPGPKVPLLAKKEVSGLVGTTARAKLVKRTINIGEYIIDIIPNKKEKEEDKEGVSTSKVAVTKPSNPDANFENPATESIATPDPEILIMAKEVGGLVGSTAQTKPVKRTITVGEYTINIIPNTKEKEEDKGVNTSKVSMTKPSNFCANSEIPATERAFTSDPKTLLLADEEVDWLLGKGTLRRATPIRRTINMGEFVLNITPNIEEKEEHKKGANTAKVSVSKPSSCDTDFENPATGPFFTLDPKILLLTRNEVSGLMGRTPQVDPVKCATDIKKFTLITDKKNQEGASTSVVLVKSERKEQCSDIFLGIPSNKKSTLNTATSTPAVLTTATSTPAALTTATSTPAVLTTATSTPAVLTTATATPAAPDTVISTPAVNEVSINVPGRNAEPDNYSHLRVWSARAHKKKFDALKGISMSGPFKRVCILPYCLRRGPQPGVSLHRFPTNETRFKRWVANCQSKVVDEIPFDKRHLKYLCSAHFHESQFASDGMLFGEAIPTLFAEAKHPLPFQFDPKALELMMRARKTNYHPMRKEVITLDDNLPPKELRKPQPPDILSSDKLHYSPIVAPVPSCIKSTMIAEMLQEGKADETGQGLSAPSTIALQIERINSATSPSATKQAPNNVILTGSKAGIQHAIQLITAQKGAINLPSTSGTLILPTDQTPAKRLSEPEKGSLKEAEKNFRKQFRELTRANARKVKRLEDKVTRLATNTRCSVKKLRNGVGCMKTLEEILPSTLYHLVALKARHGNSEKRFCAKWPPAVKEWALSIYQTSPRAYHKLQELFILPSRGHVQAMNRRVLQKQYLEGNRMEAELTESDAPPASFDYSRFEIVENSPIGKSEQRENENALALKRKLEAPIAKVDVQSLAKRLKGLFEK